MPQKLAQLVLDVFKFHKAKIFTVAISAVVFLILLFPFGDLSDLVTAKVSTFTKNQVFLQFEDLRLSLIPSLAISLNQVSIETSQLPTIKASNLTLSPLITKFLTASWGLKSNAENLLGGDLNLVIEEAGQSEAKVPLIRADVDFEKLNLNEVAKLNLSPLPLSGHISFDAKVKFDPKFVEQPDGEFKVNNGQITLEAANIPTPFGELPFPKIKFSNVKLKGRLVGSELILEEVFIGSQKDPLSASLKGKLSLKLMQRAGKIQPLWGRYEFKSELKVKQNVGHTLKLFLNFLDKFKSSSDQTDIYRFKAAGPRFGPPPQLTPY